MSPLTQAERDVLLDIADVLVPATETMPALRDADSTGEWLDRACAARADILPHLQHALHALAGVPALSTALRRLHSEDRVTFDIVATIAAGTYYLVPRVRGLIGYPGQIRTPAPLELAADELSDEIFDGAMSYPGSYRVAPA